MLHYLITSSGQKSTIDPSTLVSDTELMTITDALTGLPAVELHYSLCCDVMLLLQTRLKIQIQADGGDTCWSFLNSCCMQCGAFCGASQSTTEHNNEEENSVTAATEQTNQSSEGQLCRRCALIKEFNLVPVENSKKPTSKSIVHELIKGSNSMHRQTSLQAFTSVSGHTAIKQRLIEIILHPRIYAELYAEFKMNHSEVGVLLFGPPGQFIRCCACMHVRTLRVRRFRCV